MNFLFVVSSCEYFHHLSLFPYEVLQAIPLIDIALLFPVFFLAVECIFLSHLFTAFFLIIQQKIGDTLFCVSYLYITSQIAPGFLPCSFYMGAHPRKLLIHVWATYIPFVPEAHTSIHAIKIELTNVPTQIFFVI